MAEVGILTEDDRVELIEGELVAMAPIGSARPLSAHSTACRSWPSVAAALSFRRTLSAWMEIACSLPDFTILKPRPDGYRSVLPGPDDMLLAIEVADGSLSYDRGPKLELHAPRGLREVWIVDLVHRMIEVHRVRRGDHYAASITVERTATPGIEALSGVALAASDILD